MHHRLHKYLPHPSRNIATPVLDDILGEQQRIRDALDEAENRSAQMRFR